MDIPGLMVTERLKRIQNEKAYEYKKLLERAEAPGLTEIEIIHILEGAEWRPDLPQPLKKCFLCRLYFDSKSKAPFALPCSHNVCKECVVDRES